MPKKDKTIGSLFGMIEEKKKEFRISEYSASETSLECIFQTFANQSMADSAKFTYTKNSQGVLTCKGPDEESNDS